MYRVKKTLENEVNVKNKATDIITWAIPVTKPIVIWYNAMSQNDIKLVKSRIRITLIFTKSTS